MKYSRISITASVLVACAVWAGAAELRQPPTPGTKDRCAVCGMFVAKDTQWVAAVVLKDGSRAFFDGPKDMFRYLFEIGKYAKGKSSADVSGVYVTEYYSGRLTAADELYFVVGSDVMGPMGRELVPVKGKAQAETFLKDHKGKKVRQYKEISSADLSTLD